VIVVDGGRYVHISKEINGIGSFVHGGRGGVEAADGFEIAGSCDVVTALAAEHWQG
jgi:hypothetical protein